MHVLSTFDLNSIDIYTVPKTAALLDQKRESFAPHVQWWSECLMDGRIRCDDDSIYALTPDWPEEVHKDHLAASYRLWCRDHNVRSRIWPDSALHRWLRPLLPGGQETRKGSGRGDSPRIRMVSLPSLDMCRQVFADHLGQAIDWDDTSETPWEEAA